VHVVVEPLNGLARVILDVTKLGIPQSLIALEGDAFWNLGRGVVHAQHGVAGSCHSFLLVSREW
jgi:hypothetical protein